MVEATIQTSASDELIPMEFHVLPRPGDIIKIAAKNSGPIVIVKKVEVTKIIHVMCPTINFYDPRRNFHLINIICKDIY